GVHPGGRWRGGDRTHSRGPAALQVPAQRAREQAARDGDREPLRTGRRAAEQAHRAGHLEPAPYRPASAAWSTLRAAGAAVSPPFPARNSITATTIRGCFAGAKHVNHASVWLLLLPDVSAVGPVVLSSSAVPVLPATSPGPSAALVPVPRSTTPTISRRIVCAVRASITRRATISGPGTILGRYRTPPVAIVCEICAISRGVAATRPCPMADDPISSGDVICRAGGSVLSRAPANGTGSLKPKRSAMPTSLAAPTFTPSGAKTELHDCTNASSSVPPHDSPSAFCSVTPSMTRLPANSVPPGAPATRPSRIRSRPLRPTGQPWGMPRAYVAASSLGVAGGPI